VLAARTLTGAAATFRQNADGLTVDVAKQVRHSPVTVIELTLDKPVEVGRKRTAFFQRVIACAHRRGVRVALGVELPGETTRFVDSDNDFTDQPKRGTYYYRVTAVDKAGNESPATAPVAVSY